MKWLNTLTVMAVTVSAVLISCENEDKTKTPVPPTQELQNVTNTINNIVSEHGNYDISNVKNTLTNVFWYCDALVEFSGEWASEIINDFGGEPWVEEYEPLVEFQGSDLLKRYTINPTTNRVIEVEQTDAWSLDLATRTLSIRAAETEQYEAINIDTEILAIAEEVMVLKWQDQNEKEWYGVYKAFGRDPRSVEADLIINAAIAEIDNFDTTIVEQSIVGVWGVNTHVAYDSEWLNVTSPILVNGTAYWIVGGSYQYTFNEDGTFNYFCHTTDPTDEDTSYNGTWSFNRDNRTLSLNADGFNREYTIVGYSDELFFGDFVANNKNYRDGLVRIND